MRDGKFQSQDIYDLLLKKFEDGRQWLCAGEVANTTGGGLRRLDFVACNCYESHGYGIHAFEIKISKSDLRRELECPEKHNLFFDDIDTYSIVAPEYVLDAEYKALIPKNWGIYVAKTIGVANAEGVEVSKNTLVTVRKPLALHDERGRTIRGDFAMSMLRAIVAKSNLCKSMKELLWEAENKGYREGFETGKKQDWERTSLERQLGDEREKNRAMTELMKELQLWGYQSVDDARKKMEIARKFVKGGRSLFYWFDGLKEELPDFLKATEAIKNLVKEGDNS